MAASALIVFTAQSAATHTIEIGNDANTTNSMTHVGGGRSLMALGIAR
jgi:hypothetical protein